MSVAYQSWEVASGHLVGYNMAIQGNLCATVDAIISETPNYSSNTILSPESYMKAVTAGADVSKGLTYPNHKTLTPQDTVIQGLASISLHPQAQPQAGSFSENCETSSSCESSNKSLELNCSDPLASDGKNLFPLAACSVGYHMQGRGFGSHKSVHCDGSGFKGSEDVSCSHAALKPHSGSSDVQGSTSPNTFWVATRNYLPLYDNYGDCVFYDFPKHTLDVVVEDKPFEENFAVTGNDDLELDAFSASSTSSVSSLLNSPVDGSISSGERLYGVGESEVQSALKGLSTFAEESSPPRKGLSQFYAGKSRSFSCLGDVTSLRDLAKPENPYARKRRCHTGRSLNSGRPQLPPLQKGAASISKKAMHIGKSTLALAVTMSTQEDRLEKDDNRSILGAQRNWQQSPLTSRSYSLSDLQRVTESRVSPC